MKKIVSFLLVLLLGMAVVACDGGGEERFSVSYFANAGGDVVSGMPQNRSDVARGEVISEPQAPERAGYDFVEWCYDSAGQQKVSFPISVDGDVEFYAMWEEQAVLTYTVSFAKNAGSDTVSNMPQDLTEVAHGSKVARPQTNPARAGYTFKNWYGKAIGGDAFDFDTEIVENTIIFAQWTANTPAPQTYSITFLPNAGSDTVSDMPQNMTEVVEGTVVSKPANPSRSGYDFINWYEQPIGGTPFDFSAPINKNVTLYAQWNQQGQQANINVIYDKNTTDTVSSMPNNRLVSSGTQINKPSPNPYRVGYSFVNWFSAPTGGTEYEFPLTITEDTTLYARWTLSQTTFNVNYYANGENVTGMPQNTSVASGTVVSKPQDPSRTGYDFVDWYTQANGGSVVSFPITVTNNTDIYAHWTPVGTYSLSFDKNTTDSVSNMPASQNNLAGGTVINAPQNSPSRSGYSFAGFYDAPSGGNLVPYPITVNGNMTLYAQWIKNTVKAIMKIDGVEFDIPEGVNPGAYTYIFETVMDLSGGTAQFFYNSATALTFVYYLSNGDEVIYPSSGMTQVNLPTGNFKISFAKYSNQSNWTLNIIKNIPSKTLPGFTINSNNPDMRTEATEITSPTPETMPGHPSGTVNKIKEYRITTTFNAGDEVRFWVGSGGMQCIFDGDWGNFGNINSSTKHTVQTTGSYTIVFRQYDGQIGGSATWRITIIAN